METMQSITYLDFFWGQFQRKPWRNLKNCDSVFCPSRPDLETRETDWKLSAPPKGVPTLYLKADILKSHVYWHERKKYSKQRTISTFWALYGNLENREKNVREQETPLSSKTTKNPRKTLNGLAAVKWRREYN